MSTLRRRIQRASARLFNTGVQSIPVPFELICECGNRVSGLRRTESFLHSCSSCQNKLLVLSVNPYPATKRVPSLTSDEGPGSRTLAALRELAGMPTLEAQQEPSRPRSDAENSPEAVSAKPKSPSALSAAEPTPKPGSAPKSSESNNENAKSSPQPQPQRPRTSLFKRIRRVFSPVRMITVSTLILLSTTGWWMIQERRHDNAIRNWRSRMDVVLRALDQGDTEELMTALPEAIKAADVLQKTDAEAMLARSLFRQSDAISRLSSADLVDQLEQLAREDPETIQTAAELLRNQWFVFQSGLRPGSDSTSVSLDLPLQFAATTVTIVAEAGILREYLNAAPIPRTAFAARIDHVRIIPGPPIRIVVLLDGNSVALLTLDLLAARAGFEAAGDPELQLLLRNQQAFLSDEPMLAETQQSRSKSNTAPSTGEQQQ